MGEDPPSEVEEDALFEASGLKVSCMVVDDVLFLSDQIMVIFCRCLVDDNGDFLRRVFFCLSGFGYPF